MFTVILTGVTIYGHTIINLIRAAGGVYDFRNFEQV